jgi:hypothetical protein
MVPEGFSQRLGAVRQTGGFGGGDCAAVLDQLIFDDDVFAVLQLCN